MKNIKIRREYRRNSVKRKRMIIINHYGKKCACCGEDKIEFLAIDHIYENGNKHRKQIKVGCGIGFYNWIIKNNFPNYLQLLCHNCNMSKAFYGYCPHKNKL